MPLFRVWFLIMTFMAGGFLPLPAFAASCTEEIQRGVASWYGPGFEGSRTSSAEVYNPMILSAAHPNLPFGTVVKVTNLRNNRSVNVRVNDRGGFAKRRVIDVSQSAANELGMMADGVAPVAIYLCHGP